MREGGGACKGQGLWKRGQEKRSKIRAKSDRRTAGGEGEVTSVANRTAVRAHLEGTGPANWPWGPRSSGISHVPGPLAPVGNKSGVQGASLPLAGHRAPAREKGSYGPRRTIESCPCCALLLLYKRSLQLALGERLRTARGTESTKSLFPWSMRNYVSRKTLNSHKLLFDFQKKRLLAR